MGQLNNFLTHGIRKLSILDFSHFPGFSRPVLTAVPLLGVVFLSDAEPSSRCPTGPPGLAFPRGIQFRTPVAWRRTKARPSSPLPVEQEARHVLVALPAGAPF